MINDIRQYFKEQIAEVDADLLGWDKDLFGNNDLNASQADRYYNLIIESASFERDSGSFIEVVPVSLDIYASKCRDMIKTFDDLYDKALDIKNNIIFTQNFMGVFRFNDIEAISCEPIEEQSNDNAFKMRLNFIVRKNFKIRKNL